MSSGVPVFTLVMEMYDGTSKSVARTTKAGVKKALDAYIFKNQDPEITDQVSSRTSVVRDWKIVYTADTDVQPL